MADAGTQNPTPQVDLAEECARRLGNLTVRFVHQLDGLAEAFPRIDEMLTEENKRTIKAYLDFGDRYGVKSADGNSISIPADRFNQFKIIDRTNRKVSLAKRAIPTSLFVSLVSHFDAFLGDLLRIIFESKSELLSASEKQFTFAQVLELGSVEEIKRTLIDREVEGVLRESHAEHFAWMEKKFGVPLTKGLASWPTFIELTERRNLFVHADGVVSTQYITVCSKHGALAASVAKGDTLEVTPDYFSAAYSCILEIGVKLANVLWRKLLPETRTFADSNFNEICFNLLVDEKYEVASKLLDFACSCFKPFSSEGIRLYMVLNRAQASKWAGDDKAALAILNAEDWSACRDVLRLAELILRDEISQAIPLMKNCTSEAEIGKAGFRTWPIFRKARGDAEFQKAFFNLFGEPLLELELPPLPPVIPQPPALPPPRFSS